MTEFRLKGDSSDSLRELEDEITNLKLQYNVGWLIQGAVEDPELYNINGATRSKQEMQVNHYLLQIQSISKDSIELRGRVRNIINNREDPQIYELSTSIRKARRIEQIYLEVARLSPLKSSKCIEARKNVRLNRRDGEGLKESVLRMINEIEEAEVDLEDHLKLQNVEKMTLIIELLAGETELTSKITDIDIYNNAMTFRIFKAEVLASSQRIMDTRRIQKTSSSTVFQRETTVMSTNATTITLDKEEYDALTAAAHNSRRGRENPSYDQNSDRGRHRDRHSSPYGQSQNRDSRVRFDNRRDRSRSRSTGSPYSRGSNNRNSNSINERSGFSPYENRSYQRRSPSSDRSSSRYFSNRNSQSYRDSKDDRR